jgi:hypothetical protein
VERCGGVWRTSEAEVEWGEGVWLQSEAEAEEAEAEGGGGGGASQQSGCVAGEEGLRGSAGVRLRREVEA